MIARALAVSAWWSFFLCHPPVEAQWWKVETSGIESNLRGLSASYTGSKGKLHQAVWACGSNGVILRSTDGGKTWKRLGVAGGGDLDFRGIQAFDADVAYVMSSGDGDKSRIYKTRDGGKHWKLQYSDQRPGFFLDSLTCDSRTHCVALSDPVNGKFLVLNTDDGERWKELPRDNMPPAFPREGAFAASGTAIALCAGGRIYFGTGGPAARIFRSENQGGSWTVVETPISSGTPSSGVSSVACAGRENLVAVGGDYQEPNRAQRVAAYSEDAGTTWHLAGTQPGGYRSAAGSFSPGDFAAVGPNGTDVSHDHGVHWQPADKLNLNAVSFDGTEGWAVGPHGTVAVFVNHWQ
ncbi:MAG TPA: YCF48-related protein [Candidatus Acidoferrum sp.]|nr:YCF48-related protein [Candidatus Acidoferrum sp.]